MTRHLDLSAPTLRELLREEWETIMYQVGECPESDDPLSDGSLDWGHDFGDGDRMWQTSFRCQNCLVGIDLNEYRGRRAR